MFLTLLCALMWHIHLWHNVAALHVDIAFNYSPQKAENEREWVRDIWNEWFDQIFPPTPEESEWSEEEEEEVESPVEEAIVQQETKPKR